MKHSGLILVALALALVAVAAPMSWYVSPLGDARKAALQEGIRTEFLWCGNKASFSLPQGKWNDVTVTFWTRLSATNEFDVINALQTVGLTYSPEAIQRNLPDELAGGAGWGVDGGTNVSGSLSLPYTFTPHPSYSNLFANVAGTVGEFGCYTINAVVTNAIGISLGGIEHTLTPGTNIFNSYAGPSPYFTITGSGNVKIGMSKMRWHQYFDRINGVIEKDEYGNDTAYFTRNSMISNELVFVSCRMHLDSSSHYTRDDMFHYLGNYPLGKTITNALPDNPSCRAFDSRGDYKVGYAGIGRLAAYESIRVDFFDGRVHTRWLSDEELQRTYRNGKEEIERRLIPRFK